MSSIRFRHLAFVVLCAVSTLPFPSLLLAQSSERDLRLNTFADTGRLTLSGSATVIDDRSLLLTPSENWQAGSVFSSQLISTEEFSTFFAFRISDPGGGGADGIALIAQTVSANLGEVGGGMGYQGVPNSLAVEFDTWQNGWDDDDNHTGLLLNGDVSHRDFQAVPLPVPFEGGAIWYAWIDYDGRSLSLRLSQTRQRPDTAIFEHRLDIPDILNSPVAYVGFASATGAARARHEILEWTYLERFAPKEISEAQEIAAELSEQRRVELDIQFEFNSDVPTADGFEKIARFSEAVAQMFENAPYLTILGHTDAVGSASYNLSLSQRRANSVRNALIQRHGFPAERLTAEGRGETELKLPEAPEADENRRVEIRLAGAESQRPTQSTPDPAVSATAIPASAQSWSHEAGRAVAPRAIAGDTSHGFEVVCYQGEWFMYLFGLPTAEGAAATISVDDQSFPVTIVYGDGSDGIELNGAILAALKAGNSVRVSSDAPSSSFSSTYGLRGSSRALNAVESQCAFPSPATAPDRFLSPPMGSTSEAITLASSLLRPVLEEAHEIDPKVGIEGANLVSLENGWSFLIAIIGPSTGLYGIAAFQAVIAAKPPGEDWRIVTQQVGMATYIDSKGMTNGYPDLFFQNVRGINPPFAIWQWDGSQYELSRSIPN